MEGEGGRAGEGTSSSLSNLHPAGQQYTIKYSGNSFNPEHLGPNDSMEVENCS